MKLLATLAAVSPLLLPAAAQVSGSGATTRYWDCCKPSCAWPGKGSLAQGPLGTCDRSDNPLSDGGSTRSGCDSGGSAYMCSSHSPWAVDDNTAYGWAAVRINGQTENDWCCACYELTFTGGPVNGKKMIVQATNTGGDLGQNHFDIAMPGGGVGIFNGCTDQWGSPANGWGDRYGGIHSRSECDGFPEKLKPGCYWRFDWFGNADNPPVNFRQVDCPAEIVAKSGCRRN
ncbi:related to Endoglucanase-5 [Cephalotrichum gorgonifer]|uniref:Cellulase n=1 Tax=Cephalotrichum gorgonifer TaxID=2041049 RepID=A0AAE8MXI8_9PEZI|nr:related to Endoglucanase-5 [Cephalotrichum gorgonifer]